MATPKTECSPAGLSLNGEPRCFHWSESIMRFKNTLTQILVAMSALMLAANVGCRMETTPSTKTNSPPPLLLGSFVDDYDIEYTITKNYWEMKPGIRYNIIRWNTAEQFILAKNDPSNPTAAGRFTRIDYMLLEVNQSPYLWGFCLSAYDAESLEQAKQVATADRNHPRQGCNGYPFSRMKRIQSNKSK